MIAAILYELVYWKNIDITIYGAIVIHSLANDPFASDILYEHENNSIS